MKRLTIAVGMLLGLGLLTALLATPASAAFCKTVACSQSAGTDTVCCSDPGVPSGNNICGQVDDTIGGCIDASGPAGCIPALLGACEADAATACDACGCATHTNPGC